MSTPGPFQTAAWIAAASATGRYADASVAAGADGDVLLPALRRRRPGGFRGSVGSMPLGWGFGGVVGPERVGPEHVRCVVDELSRGGWPAVLLRPAPDQDEAFATAPVGWSTIGENASFEVDLAGGWEAVSGGFSSSVRRAVRKAEHAGVSVRRRTDAAALDEFCRLYELSVRRWAAQSRVPEWVYAARAQRLEPRSKFRMVQRELGDSCGVWVAEHAGRAVAAIIVLSHGREYAYWRGAMDVDLAGPVRANDLLHAVALEDACATGGRRYAMGLTAPGSGLARFKRGFGARMRVSHEYGLYSAGRLRGRRAAQRARSLVRSRE